MTDSTQDMPDDTPGIAVTLNGEAVPTRALAVLTVAPDGVGVALANTMPRGGELERMVMLAVINIGLALLKDSGEAPAEACYVSPDKLGTETLEQWIAGADDGGQASIVFALADDGPDAPRGQDKKTH